MRALVRSPMLVLLAATLPSLAAGAIGGGYVGVGESAVFDQQGYCLFSGRTALVLQGPSNVDGTWWAELDAIDGPDEGCLNGEGWKQYPLDVLEGIRGDPAVGMHAEGEADYIYTFGTASVRWTFDLGAVGPATPFVLHESIRDDGDGSVTELWWNGTLHLVGAHV